MAAGLFDLTIEQGTDFQESFGLEDESGDLIDLTDYSALAQVRRHPADYADLALEFDVEIEEIELRIVAASAQTLDLDLGSGGVWDLEIANDEGEVVRWLQGRVKYSREVTR